VVFWVFTFGEETDDVRGVTTRGNGILINIVSKKGAWEMSKYLCEDISKCSESLTSGKSLAKTSGGGVEEQSVIVRPSNDWSSSEYLKIFVKSGWGSAERFFVASVGENVRGSVIEKFNYGGNTYEAVIVPIDLFRSEFVDSITFTD
jgi:hypothetical protein